jgi:hypothetical protein
MSLPRSALRAVSLATSARAGLILMLDQFLSYSALMFSNDTMFRSRKLMDDRNLMQAGYEPGAVRRA